MVGLKSSYWRMRRSCGLWLSRKGDRLGIESLTYNQVIFEAFSRYAEAAAPGVAEVLTRMFPHVKRVVDIGCGTGHFVRALRRLRVDAEGLEYSPRARQVAAAELGITVSPLDLRSADRLAIRSADLAMSIEVAEHVPPMLGDNLVALLTRTAPLVFFTAATPGQGGTGHVNEQPNAYWIDRFSARGFGFEESTTEAVRLALASTVVGSPWIAKNAMIFRQAS